MSEDKEAPEPETEATLLKMLNELKNLTKSGWELSLSWRPGARRIERIGGVNYALNGEVTPNNVIIIYVKDFKEAKAVLMHEFLEHIIKREFSEPYILLSQMVSQAYEDIIYFRQENIIDALTILLSKLPRKKKLERLHIIEEVEEK